VNDRRQLGDRAYQVTETVAVLQRSIWRRARDMASGSSVMLHSLRNGHAEPRHALQLELQRWRRIGALRIENEPCEVDGELSLVVEDFQGAPLTIPANGLQLEVCLELALELSRLLHRLHDGGLFHEDVSPGSFLVDMKTRRVEFADLLAVSEASSGTSSEFAPSLAHVAPERTGRLNRRADHRADYYSLGITLFQMLTGRLPFAATDAIGWAHAHVSKCAPLVTEMSPEVPPIVAQLVSKLLAKDPDERYQSGHGLLSDLITLVESQRRADALPALVLGRYDVSSQFRVSREIAGREGELTRLGGALDDVRSGRTRLVLLPGALGMGKSAVIAEFVRRQAGTAVRLLSTTFEERAQAVPLSGLAQALQGLAADLLALPEVELDEPRRRVSAALGRSADIMAELVPALGCVTGPSASIVPLNPIEARRRIQHVFVSFISVFATPERPLAFVLDDCQWLDAASAELLSAVLTGPDSGHVMVLAAFRGDQASDVPALQKMQHALEQANDVVVTVPLVPLSSGAVAEIVARSLRTSAAEIGPLAEIVKRKSDGNPFFIGQLLESLQRQGMLRLDIERSCWSADLQRAEAHSACDNVGTLMADRLERVSPEVARVLSAAACFGMRFDIETLCEVLDTPRRDCLELVRSALAHRLLSEVAADAREKLPSEAPRSGRASAGYMFEHSLVQQAALSRASDAERVAWHARIGRILRRRPSSEAAASELFVLLHHLNAARSCLKDRAERLDLVELNCAASNQALRSGAWMIAGSHAQIAVELLDGGERELSPDLAFRALLTRAETAFVLADPGVEAFCEQAFAVAPHRAARGRVHVLWTRVLEHGGRMLEAIAQVRTALAEFGVRLPEAPDEITRGISEGVGKLQAHLGRVKIEELSALPIAEDAESRLILELLAQVIPAAFQTCPPLFLLAELTMFDLALCRGVHAASCKNFADCGILLIALLGDYDAAHRLGLAAFELLKRFGRTPVEAGVCFVFAGFLSHWKEPYREVFAVYERVERSGLELGDLQHVAYAKNDRTQRSFLIGARLRACRDQVAETRRYLRHSSAPGQWVNTLAVERAVARLTASDSEKEAVAAADREATALIVAEKSAQYSYAYGHAQMLTSFILGDFASAQHWLEFTRDFLLIAAGQFSLPDYKLIEGLLAARACREGAGSPEALLEIIAANLQQLEAWSRLCAENFAHKYHLLGAEHARLTGQPLQVVLSHYRDALTTAGDGFMHLRALVYELEAELWLSLREPLHARTCLEAACQLYSDWGASAKLELLTRQYPALLADVVGHENATLRRGLAPSQGFDSASLLKATQSIFVEVEPQRLFAALMATLIENAGAEHGCLLLRDDGDRKYYVEARAHVQRPAAVAQREAYTDAEDVCASVVSYVLRTGETVALDDASKSGAFQADPRVRKRGVRSVLCAPIMRQGEVLGAFYAENNQSAYAFTRERTAALQVIASQAAISIYNAQLYENLEQRVAQRTEELALKNRQIASMLDNLDQGVFTIDRTLRIEPGHSRRLADILGTEELVGRDCLALLLTGAAVPSAVQSAAEAALCFSFDQEPSLAALNAGHLIHEIERASPAGDRQFLDISWNFIVSEAGQVERVLVTVRDSTLLRRLKQTARNKEREVEIIVQVLDCGVDALRAFGVECRQLLAENRTTLASQAEVSQQWVAAGFRNLHALKGNARLHGLTHLVDCLHSVEDTYDELRRKPEQPLDRHQISKQLDAVESLLADYEAIYQHKLAPLARKSAETSEERNEAVLRDILALAALSPGDPQRDLLPELRAVLARLDVRSVLSLVDEMRPLLPGLAAELGKPAPTLVTQHAEAQLGGDWARLVRDILVQCFRNSLYHGLETPHERELAGKPARGKIQVSLYSRPSDWVLEIFDDGRGLALAKLRERAGDRGLPDEDLAQQIFISGVSTAETIGQVAGRGIGLDIVRAGLQARGGDALVRFTGEERDGHRPFVLVLVLPESALASRPGAEANLPGLWRVGRSEDGFGGSAPDGDQHGAVGEERPAARRRGALLS
jgi:predicted ATPase/GAF domain-containing protein/HPt (histidine-containing phosphotransfer) domain-containing protein